MAAFRAFVLIVALAAFFLVGAPLQWLIARRAPRHAHHIPLVFCRSLLRIIGIRVTVEGANAGALETRRAIQKPVLLVANHVSWIDILAFGALTPFCFLAKREVATWPMLSAFAEVQGTVFVDRARRRTIPLANRMMARRMQEGRPVLLFPEGTTISADEPGPFRSSHYAAARDFLRMATPDTARTVQVQPVAIAYASAAAPWVGDEALVPHLWRVLRAAPFECAISFAAPLAYAEGADRKAIARRSREAVIEALGRHCRAAVSAGARQNDEICQPATTGC